jgi:hypothetical protein
MGWWRACSPSVSLAQNPKSERGILEQGQAAGPVAFVSHVVPHFVEMGQVPTKCPTKCGTKQISDLTITEESKHPWMPGTYGECAWKCGPKGSGVTEPNAASELGFYPGVLNLQWLARQFLAHTPTICGNAISVMVYRRLFIYKYML